MQNHSPEQKNLNKLFNVKGGKFKLSAQESGLGPFVGNGTKDKKPSEITLPLSRIFRTISLMCSYLSEVL